jgi:hypothetical protein
VSRRWERPHLAQRRPQGLSLRLKSVQRKLRRPVQDLFLPPGRLLRAQPQPRQLCWLHPVLWDHHPFRSSIHAPNGAWP